MKALLYKSLSFLEILSPERLTPYYILQLMPIDCRSLLYKLRFAATMEHVICLFQIHSQYILLETL